MQRSRIRYNKRMYVSRNTVLALKSSYFEFSKLAAGCSASGARCRDGVAWVPLGAAWLPMGAAAYGRDLAAYGRRRLASYALIALLA